MKTLTLINLLAIATFSTFFCLAEHKFYVYPQINLDELNKKKSSINEDVHAEVLYYSIKIEVDNKFNYSMTVFKKIKIYDKEKADKEGLLNLEVPLRINSQGFERMTSFKANVYKVLNGKEIQTQKVEKNNQHYENTSKDQHKILVAFPNVQDGSIIEYKYVIFSPFIYKLPKHFFEDEIPIVYEEYLFDYPEYFGYNYNYRGQVSPTHLINNTRQEGSLRINFIHMGFENLPKIKLENFVKNIYNYISAIQPELNSYNLGNDRKSFAVRWKDVQKELDNHEKFGFELGKNRLIKDFIPENIRKIKDNDEKINKVLELVQNNTKWNGEYAMLADKGIKSLISDGIGNSAEINFLLLMCLRDLEIEAFPFIVSTTNREVINTGIPNVYCGNHVIVTVKSPDSTFHYLDATSKISNLDVLPAMVYNFNGIRLEKNDAVPVTIENKIFSVTNLIVEAILDKDGIIKGKFEDKDENTVAIESFRYFENKKRDLRDIYEKRYEFKLNEITSEISDNKSFRSVMSFTSDNLVNQISGKFYINPFLFLYNPKHEFSQIEERVYPIEFISPKILNKKVILKIPVGYKVEKLPVMKRINTPDKLILYLASYKVENDEIIVESHIEVRKDNFPADYYPAFKQIYDAMTSTEGQLIQLVKN